MRCSVLSEVGLNKIQRECARIGLKDEVVLETLPREPPSLGYVTAAVDFYMKPKQRVEVRQSTAAGTTGPSLLVSAMIHDKKAQ